MRSLKSISFLVLLMTSCATAPPLTKTQTVQHQKFGKRYKSEFKKALYRCQVNGRIALKKFHLSGLLYLRHFNDTTVRVVFQNEIGFTYFDFGWDKHDSFTVYRIIDKMNRPALIQTLRKDFEIILSKKVQAENDILKDKETNQFISKHGFYKGFVYYYWLNKKMNQFSRIDYGTEKNILVRFQFQPIQNMTKQNPLPTVISIKHFRAGFTIQLKKLSQDD